MWLIFANSERWDALPEHLKTLCRLCMDSHTIIANIGIVAAKQNCLFMETNLN
ncbi:hypothetical protein [Vibrio alfacsensis]|uniref:hypothetical protein n=1 Tax=Vibrio alfacsensis TaxID=1074311 RepID=UPI0040698534